MDASPRLRLARFREDEVEEDGVEVWTRPLGSDLPETSAYDLTVDESDDARDVRPPRADVRQRRGGRAARMSDAAGAAGMYDAAGAAGRRGCPTALGGGMAGMSDGAGRRDGGDVRRRWTAGILLPTIFTGGRALGTDATGYVRRLCPCE
jgi:hypothetical protein